MSDFMGTCVCGHSVEEHPKYGACVGRTDWEGKDEPCRCIHYDEDEP